MHKILVINIGSTSTKIAAFAGRDNLFRQTIEHSFEDLSKLNDYDDWLAFHKVVIEQSAFGKNSELDSVSMVVSRGGLTRPVQGGAYRINEAMLRTLRDGDYGWHPSNIGPPIARDIADRFGADAVIFDSPVTDELEPPARFSGLKGVDRQAGMHVLSQKSAARKAAKELKISYNRGNFIVAHLGGGITMGMHCKGRIIDGTHGLSEGPFTPQRTGALPLKEIIKICYSGEHDQKGLERMLFSRGGVFSYLGTHSVKQVEDRVAGGDNEARFVLEAMAYQISKEICSLAAVTDGDINAVVLTGNLCKAATVLEEIKKRVKFLAPLLIYSGEDELENLAVGGLRVLEGKETAGAYK